MFTFQVHNNFVFTFQLSGNKIHLLLEGRIQDQVPGGSVVSFQLFCLADPLEDETKTKKKQVCGSTGWPIHYI